MSRAVNAAIQQVLDAQAKGKPRDLKIAVEHLREVFLFNQQRAELRAKAKGWRPTDADKEWTTT